MTKHKCEKCAARDSAQRELHAATSRAIARLRESAPVADISHFIDAWDKLISDGIASGGITMGDYATIQLWAEFDGQRFLVREARLEHREDGWYLVDPHGANYAERKIR